MLAFAIWVTEKCNLRCRYCYENGNFARNREMNNDIDDVLSFIDFFANKYPDDEILISFHGGEPLLKIDLIKNYVANLKQKYSEKVQFGITTNGTLLTEKIAKVLNENFSDLSVSIDGLKAVHDKNRIYTSGEGSYDKILENIEKSGIEKSRIRVRMTIMAESSSYFKSSVENLLDNGFYYIVPAVAANDNAWSEETFEQLQKEVESLLENGGSKLEFIKRLINEKHILTKCVGGIKTFNISVDKKVYPCEYIVGNVDFSIGTVYSPQKVFERNRELTKLYENSNEGKCETCSYSEFCEATRCKYYNFINSGHLLKPSDNQCMIEHLKYRMWRKYGKSYC